jgi:glutaredoxin 3
MITVYTTSTCVFCKALKKYLDTNKISYKNKNLDNDQEAVAWVYQKTGQMSVPVVDIGGEIIVGFDRPRIEALLRDKNLI